MKYKNNIRTTDMKTKNISREEFASELSPLSKMAQGIYIAENSDVDNIILNKKKINEKRQKDNLAKELNYK